ncbi:MAG: zinc ABC transporter substrate-binding protein [Desulfurococcaceae archaeon]|nr:zinc ABC transporter substrate-binding protein [Desulfurococcaceae archaeon]
MLKISRLTILLILVLLMISLAIWVGSVHSQGIQGVKIVVTFPFMIKDIEALLCENDDVYYLVPPGVDPHDYQLTYRDIEILSRANLIVSTAHTPFELKIREMVLSGELKAKLIEIPSITNISLLIIPGSSNINYHGVLFHGNNFAIFIENITSILTHLRPQCREVYLSKSRTLIDKIEKTSSKPLKDLKTIVDTPPLQYLASWFGAEVIQILITEHGVPVAPQDVEKAEEYLRIYRENTLVIVTEDSPARNLLEDFAHRYRAKLLVIPNPITSTDSIAEYLEDFYNRTAMILTSTTTKYTSPSIDYNKLIIMLSAIIIVIAVVGLRFKRR